MPSHVTILAAGTRGDVQPYIALALGLREAGHEVTLGANAEFETLIESHRVPFHPLRVDYLAFAETPEGREALRGNPLTATRRLRARTAPMVRRLLDDAWEAAQDTDAVVYHPKTLAGPHLSERLGVPAFAAAAVPMLSPTRAFAVPGLTRHDLGPLNRASYRLAGIAAGMYRETVEAWRVEVLDLPRTVHGGPLPKLYAYSEAVLPRPSDWGADTVVTGYWPLPPAPGWRPDPALERFLGAGPPPVYVGFGSMPLTDPQRTAREVAAGLRASGARGLLDGPLGAAVDDAGDDMLAIGGVPHHWLFDRVAAVVHHGGAGTTGAGLRAGRPTVIVPHAVDQPFWARAVHARGASPRPLSPARLDARRLADAVSQALADPIAGRAAALGRTLRREDGVAAATALLGAAIAPARIAA
jgi:sterol 3beta-glucosyltransferase